MSFTVSSDTSTYDYMNSFFGTTSTSSSSSSSSSTTSLLGDYYSVQNGSYYKLAKKYYATSSSSSSTSNDSATEEKQLKLTGNAAESAVKSLGSLMDSDLFNKVSTTDDDGNTTYDYDKKSILSKIKSFIDDYNDVIDDSSDLDNTSTLKSAVRLTNETKVYSSALSKIGISVGSDNKLSIDEDAFDAADMADAKDLFTGSTSFATNTESELLKVYNSATSALNSSGSIYSSSGVTSLTTGNMFDSLL